MPFKLPCACGKMLLLKDEWAGRKVRCSNCQQILLAEQPAAAKPEEEPPEVDVTEVAVTAAPPKFATAAPSSDVGIEDGERTPAKPRRRRDDDEEDDRPWSKSKKRRAEDDEEEEDDDRQRSKSKKRRDDDNDKDDDRQRSKSKKRRDDDYDDDLPKSRSRRERAARGQAASGMGTQASIGTGVLMMVGAVVWCIGGLAFDYFFYYPPILFIMGIVVTVRGAMQRE